MSTEEESEVRNRQPKNSKFKQQALPAWQPILTAGTVLPAFFVIGVAFIPIGNLKNYNKIFFFSFLNPFQVSDFFTFPTQFKKLPTIIQTARRTQLTR